MKTRLAYLLVLVLGILGAAHSGAQPTPPSPVPPTADAPIAAVKHVPERSNVSVGIYLVSLYDIAPATSSFLIDFYVWTNQKSASFDPLASAVFPGTRQLEVLFQSLREVDGVQWSLRRYRGTFYHDWNLRNFPFDKHELKVQLRDSVHRTREVHYQPDIATSGVDRQFDLPGWRISDFRIAVEDVEYGTTFGDPGADEDSFRVFSWTTATVVMKRDALGLFLKLLTGAYIAFGAAMFACLMKTTQPPVFAGRMGLQISCLFAAIINNRTTDAILGRDDQITLPDMLHILIYFIIFLAMVITLRSRVLCEKGEEERAKNFERRTTAVMVAIFIITNIVLICRAALSPVLTA
jgi:hypothetical protein